MMGGEDTAIAGTGLPIPVPVPAIKMVDELKTLLNTLKAKAEDPRATEAIKSAWDAILEMPCINKNIDNANACDVEQLHTILYILRDITKNKERMSDIEAIEHNNDIVYIDGFKSDYLLKISKLFMNVDTSEKKQRIVNDILSCIIFGIKYSADSDFPEALQKYEELFSNKSILENTTIAKIELPNGQVKELKKDDEKLAVAQNHIATAMWIKLLRTLDDNLDIFQGNGSSSGRTNRSGSNASNASNTSSD